MDKLARGQRSKNSPNSSWPKFVRASPAMVISLSPAVYPWSWDYYLLEWPKWAAWSDQRWDEFIPQAYRFSYEAFDKTWRDQSDHMHARHQSPAHDLMAGIRRHGRWQGLNVGATARFDSTPRARRQRRTCALVQQGRAGHVRERIENSLRSTRTQPAFSAAMAARIVPCSATADWRTGGEPRWVLHDVPPGIHRLIGFDGTHWGARPCAHRVAYVRKCQGDRRGAAHYRGSRDSVGQARSTGHEQRETMFDASLKGLPSRKATIRANLNREFRQGGNHA